MYTTVSLSVHVCVICVPTLYTSLLNTIVTQSVCLVCIQTLDISLLYETYDDLDSPELEYPPTLAKANAGTVPQQGGGITGGGTGSGSGGGGGGGGGSSGSFSSATSDAKSPTVSVIRYA